MKSIQWFVGIVFFLLAVKVSAAPVGMICSLKGKAHVNGDTARVLQNLKVGDMIACEPNSSVIVVIFGNGERFKLTGKGTVQGDIVTGAVALGGLQGASAEAARTIVGSRTGATLSRDPIPTSRIRGIDPDWISDETRSLSWKAVPEASSYTFSLYDTHDDAVYTARTAGNVSQVSLKSANLVPGQVYIWKMTARNEKSAAIGRKRQNQTSPPVRWGTLAVLTDKEIESVKAGAKGIEAMKKDGDDKSFIVLLAGIYRSHGLLKLAIETLEDAGESEAQKDLEYELGNIGWFYSNPGVQPLRGQ